MEKLLEAEFLTDVFEKNYARSASQDHRKRYAQFFTPVHLASLMGDWLLGNPQLQSVLEPAFGLGIFSRLLLQRKPGISVKGFEVDSRIHADAVRLFDAHAQVEVKLADYMYNDWDTQYDGIVCNPPYFKFHDYDSKAVLEEVMSRLSVRPNGFTNLYSLFLLKSIHQLKPNGRLAYLIPSEFLNSDYGKLIKAALIKSKAVRHLVVFDFEDNVFDDALTTACIVFCANDPHDAGVRFSTVRTTDDLEAIRAYIAGYPACHGAEGLVSYSSLDPEVKWRKYYQAQNGLKYKDLIPLSSVAKVVRGIATGANEYFMFSKSKALQHGISEEFLMPCIGKATDVKGSFFGQEMFQDLAASDRPVFILNAVGAKDVQVRDYIRLGEKESVHKRFLTSCRTPWYALENRPPAPIWVSVFNRTGLKFIRNEAGVANLTTFHCIYPRQAGLFGGVDTDLLFAYLLTDVAKEIFEDNRREYGNGLKKFEPNDLNKAMILDLTKLDAVSESQILFQYHQYRASAIKGTPDRHALEAINRFFVEKFLQC